MGLEQGNRRQVGVNLASSAEFRIGRVHLSPPHCEVRTDERTFRLQPRVMQVLVLLHSLNGKVATKEELIIHCWEGAAVSDDAITRIISQLRKFANDLGGDVFTIRTVPKVGYALDTIPVDATDTDQPRQSDEQAQPDAVPAQDTNARKGSRSAFLIGAVALTLVFAGALLWASGALFQADQTKPVEAVGLAILPLEVSDHPDDEGEQLGGGIAATMNANLNGLSGLALTSDRSVASLAAMGLDSTQIAERLDIEHVVEGNVRFSGDDVVITIALVEAATSRRIWSSTRRGKRRFTYLLVNSFSSELAAVLSSRFGIGGLAFEGAGIDDPQASESYLRGMQYFAGRSMADNRQNAYLELSEVVQLEPNFAPAHAALAIVAQSNRLLAPSYEEQKAVAENSAKRALELDPDNLLAQVANESLALRYGGDVEDSIAALEVIVREHPDYALGQYTLGTMLAEVGEHEQALSHYRQALRIDPVDFEFKNMRSHSLLATGDYFELRRLASSCSGCAYEMFWWDRGLMWLTNDTMYEVDRKLLVERGEDMGFPDPGGIYSAVRSAVRERRTLPEGWDDLYTTTDVNAIPFIAASGDYELALERLRTYPFDRPTAGVVMYILDTDDDLWPKEVRADPRYHAFFNRPGLKSVIDARRARGHLQNLPLFPVEPYQAP